MLRCSRLVELDGKEGLPVCGSDEGARDSDEPDSVGSVVEGEVTPQTRVVVLSWLPEELFLVRDVAGGNGELEE